MQEFLERMKLEAMMADSRIGRLRHAIVSAVDAKTHTVKVTIQPEGIESGWIPDSGFAAGGLKIACPCEVDTQVVIAPMEGDAEHPVIVGRLFDATKTPPVSPASGDVVQPGEIGIFADQGVYLHLSRKGIAIGGDLHVAGRITADGDIRAGGVSLEQHLHTGVKAGSDMSGQPIKSQG
jgi:phage baseplate assembly protein gpV